MLKRCLYFLFLFPSLLMAVQPIEGKEYEILTHPPAPIAPSKGPVVTEFFSYGCPSCYKLEPKLKEWLTPIEQSITFNKVPVIFHQDWDLYARAYYTAKILAFTDKMSPLLFDAIQNKKQKLNQKQDMINFFVAQGLDKTIIQSAFTNSPTIDLYIAKGNELMASHQVTAVPSFVINNKYKTSLKMAGSVDHLFEIINELMRKS